MALTVFLWSLFIMAWVVVTLGVLYLDARLSGWHSLALKYPLPEKLPPNGLRLKAETVWLENGGVGYHSMVTVTIHREGLQLAMSLLPGLFYAPMFLPWKDVAFAGRKRGWFSNRVKLAFAQSPNDPITISGTLANRILASVGPTWQESAKPQSKH